MGVEAALSLAIFSYKVTYDAVEISLWGIPLRRISFSNIQDILLGAPGWNNENWTVFKLQGLVTIRKKRGLIKNVVIAPDNPQAFVALVRERMATFS